MLAFFIFTQKFLLFSKNDVLMQYMVINYIYWFLFRRRFFKLNCVEYLELSPTELLEVLIDNFIYDIPNEILSPEDYASVSEMLSSTSNQYSFLVQLSCAAKIQKRLASRRKDKTAKEDLIDKETIIDNIVSAVKLRYSTLSRMITIKQEYNKEINMNKLI